MADNSIAKPPIAALVLALWILAPSGQAQKANISADAATELTQQPTRETFVRTELYFGTEPRGIAPVSDAEWRDFLDFVITKRFPEGLTVITADGQFQDDWGNVIKEKTMVLILLYPLREWKKRNESIEFIRDSYKKAFKQQSVLRVHSGTLMKVSF